MSKILTLSTEEAQQLRIQLLKAFKSETGKDFTPVTYLGAYDYLRAFILSKLVEKQASEGSGATASVSLHRLRKLFYYSDPMYCPPDKLELPSFGEDFILPIQKIIHQNKPRPENPEPIKVQIKTKKKNFLVAGGLLSLAFISYLLLGIPHKPYYFRDDFQNNSVEALKARGWEIMDFDSSLFFPQDTGVLTLRSSRGDYWMQVGDTPIINNAIILKIPDLKCFQLTTKFTFPNNVENWQQCGIFFLDKTLDRANNIRITYVCRDPNAELQRGFQVIINSYGEITQPNRFGLEGIRKYDTVNYNFYLKIVKNDSDYSVLTHVDENGFEPRFNANFHFEPRYIALVAFNGYRSSTNGPLITASSIPAKFDWIKIKECE